MGSCCTAEWTYPRGSVEYLDIEIDSSVMLDTQPVEISFDGETWLAGTWIGDPGYKRTVRLLVDFGGLYRGEYHVRVKITDSPEVPIIFVGVVKVR